MVSMVSAKAKAFSPGLVVAVCFGIAMLEGYDIQSLGVAMPALGPLLHLTALDKGNALTAASVGLVLGAVFGGWLADRIGRKPVLAGSVVWFGAFSLATILANSADTLMLARFATGLGFGGAMPNLIAVATEISRPERRSLTTTTIFVGMPAGGSVVSLVAFFSPHGFDWRLIFVVGGAAPLLLAPLAMLLLPETRPAAPTGPVDRRSLAALFGGGRALTTVMMWIAFALTLVVVYLMVNWMPTLAIAKGVAKAQAPLTALSFNLVGIFGGVIAGMLADRFGFRWLLAAIYVALVAVMGALIAASGFWPMMALAGLAGLLVLAANYVLYAMAPIYYAAVVRGTGSGAAVAAGRIGSIVGPYAAGLLLAGGASAGQVMQSTIPVVLGAGLAAVLLTVVGRPHRD